MHNAGSANESLDLVLPVNQCIVCGRSNNTILPQLERAFQVNCHFSRRTREAVAIELPIEDMGVALLQI